MIKRLASIALLSLPMSLLSTTSASAAECNLLGGVITNCTQPSSSPPPSSSPSQPAEQQPAQQQPAPSQPSRPAGTIAEVPGAAARLLDLVNGERTSRGMTALTVRGDVVAIAGPHSTDMAGRRTIWHNDGYFTEATRASLRSKARGENVAMNSSLEDAHVRLMNSPGHRANILNGGFTQAGFSVVHDEAGQLYVTQNFMTPDGSGTKAAPAKKAKATKITKARATRATKATKAKSSRAKATKAGGPRRARTARR